MVLHIICVGTAVVNPGRSASENNDDDVNQAVLIGVLVPVLLILLAITAIMIIATIYMVKRSR